MQLKFRLRGFHVFFKYERGVAESPWIWKYSLPNYEAGVLVFQSSPPQYSSQSTWASYKLKKLKKL